MSVLRRLDEIAFEAAWQQTLADLRAEGVDTDALIKRAIENISYWQSVPFEELPQEVTEDVQHDLVPDSTEKI